MSARRNPDVIDQAVGTGLEIWNGIYAIPGAAFSQSIKAGLQGKDALKKRLKINPEDEIRYELLRAAETSRNVEELARLHKWAIAKGDGTLRNTVENRARDLGISLTRIRDAYPRKWNPRVTDRALRYRANANAPDGPEVCCFCGSKESIDVGHMDGHEENNDPSNLAWLCRSCNVASGNAMRSAGLGRLTRQYNPKGATTVGEWVQAVGAITPHKGRKYAGRNYGLASEMPVAEAVAIIRATSPAKRAQFARELGKHKSARRRSNPENSAAHFYKKFHGRDSEEELVIETEIHEHEWLGVLGILCAVVVDTPTGGRATIHFDPKDAPWLCSSEDGCQLYIEGGCQEINLKKLEMDGKDWYKERMVLGQFSLPEPGRKWNLSYVTEKEFDAFETIEYQHDLGEANEGEPKSMRREAPILEYDAVNNLLYIVGGQYKIDLPMLETSPGIEN